MLDRSHGGESNESAEKEKGAFLGQKSGVGCANLMGMTRTRILEWILRISLGGFFIWSGGMKLLDLGDFTESVGNFQLPMESRLPGNLEDSFAAPADAYVAYSLPWFEILAGLAVVSGVAISGGLVILAGMLLSFNLALWSAWNRGIVDLKCGCHGASDTPTDFSMKIASNFGLVAVVALIFGLIWYQRRLSDKDLT
jgi:uncharacterized membrane protein YphA (DoxX/SURF4 family)